jgi:cephalosporin hydroxylase
MMPELDEEEKFRRERIENKAKLANDPGLHELAQRFLTASAKHKYSYNFDWLGRPVIQYPQDLVAMQEIIWRIKPDAIIETGIARGGSLIFYASLLALLGGDRRMIGIDVDIRPHNRTAIETHPMAKYIDLIEGSSLSPDVLAKVRKLTEGRRQSLIVLDSNHTHDHVLKELQIYSPFVRCGSYVVVFDTVIEDMPENSFPERPWGNGNNPKTAVHAFLKSNDRFEIDTDIENKLLITTAPSGYLRCVKD